MSVRLGRVLYWLFNILAVAILLWPGGNPWEFLTGSLGPSESNWETTISIIAAIGAWLIGRTCRYVLAGE